MFWDSHCHLFKEDYQNIDEVIQRAKECKVGNFLVAGCDGKNNKEVLDLVKKHEEIYGALGLHPLEILNIKNEDLTFLEKNLTNDKILAIGEIGLDYYYTKDNKEEQKALFKKQLQLAEKYNLPVVIHSREATKDTINILKEYKVKGVIHSFSLSKEVAQIYIKMGFKLGINGVVTFKNSHLKEILKDIIDDIILETDSPYLTPHPFRGQKNEPKYILNIANFICEQLNISLEQLIEITNKNILEVFSK